MGDRSRPAAVFLHVGPGSGCAPGHRQLFNANDWFAIFPDQRGAGQSTPSRSRENNTTHHLVADLERIRLHFGIERWLVVGGSWGATLALAYAEAHPERVAGLALRAVFLGTPEELRWAFLTGPARLRPELLAQYLGLLTEAERQDPIAAYYARILDGDPETQRAAAWMWHDVERVLSDANPNPTRVDTTSHADPSRPLPSTALMEAHYFRHDCWLEPGQLLRDAGRLKGIPGLIVQGRYDLLCPPATSFAFQAKWPDAEIRFVEMAGHALGDPKVAEAVTRSIADLRPRAFPATQAAKLA